MAKIKLTNRALDDLDEIEHYSINQFGNKVANKYLDDIETGLDLLQQNSGLLQGIEGFSGKLKFYRVRSHFLICTLVKADILVLTIKHVQRDIINKLSELEPGFVIEIDLYSQKLK